jgi:hypothetical protein
VCFNFLATAVGHDKIKLGAIDQKDLEYKHMIFTLLIEKYCDDPNIGKIFLKRLTNYGNGDENMVS